MSTVHSSIDQHPDLLALRASFDRAAESTIAHFTFGLALLAGLYVAASPWIVGFSATRGLPTCDLIVGIAVAYLAYGFASALDRTHGMTWTLPVLGVWGHFLAVGATRGRGDGWHDVVAHHRRCGGSRPGLLLRDAHAGRG